MATDLNLHTVQVGLYPVQLGHKINMPQVTIIKTKLKRERTRWCVCLLFSLPIWVSGKGRDDVSSRLQETIRKGTWLIKERTITITVFIYIFLQLGMRWLWPQGVAEVLNKSTHRLWQPDVLKQGLSGIVKHTSHVVKAQYSLTRFRSTWLNFKISTIDHCSFHKYQWGFCCE